MLGDPMLFGVPLVTVGAVGVFRESRVGGYLFSIPIRCLFVVGVGG